MTSTFGTKKESVLDLNTHLGKEVHVKFVGGREVKGILRGFDAIINLTLDAAEEYLRDPTDPTKVTNETRTLGMVVCRGNAVMCVYPTEGATEVANPWLDANEPDDE